MTGTDILNLIAALGIGTILATLLQLHFENRRFKIERTSNLNKEIYFKKVEAWEKMCVQIMLIDTEVNQYVKTLIGGSVFLAKLSISMDERIKELSVLDAWFSEDVRDAWNEAIPFYEIIFKTYLLASQGEMTKEQGDECVKAITPFKEALKNLKEKIRIELDEEKRKIV